MENMRMIMKTKDLISKINNQNNPRNNRNHGINIATAKVIQNRIPILMEVVIKVIKVIKVKINNQVNLIKNLIINLM